MPTKSALRGKLCCHFKRGMISLSAAGRNLATLGNVFVSLLVLIWVNVLAHVLASMPYLVVNCMIASGIKAWKVSTISSCLQDFFKVAEMLKSGQTIWSLPFFMTVQFFVKVNFMLAAATLLCSLFLIFFWPYLLNVKHVFVNFTRWFRLEQAVTFTDWEMVLFCSTLPCFKLCVNIGMRDRQWDDFLLDFAMILSHAKFPTLRSPLSKFRACAILLPTSIPPQSK